MKRLFIILVILLANSAFSQKNIFYKFDKLLVNVSVELTGENYQVSIEFINNSDKDIFIPKLVSDDLNFFVSGNKIYSFYGLSFSLFGEQNPHVDVQLLKIISKEKYVHTVVIPVRNNIETLCFGFDYLRSVKRKYLKDLFVDYKFFTENKFTFYTEYKLN